MGTNIDVSWPLVVFNSVLDLFSAFCTIPNSPRGAKITVLGRKTAHIFRNTRSEVIMVLEWANMDDISVVYPGRVYIGHLIAPGLL